MKTQFLISTILLSLSTPALCNHSEGDFRRIARQDQPSLESAVFDEADQVSVLDMAEVRIYLNVFSLQFRQIFFPSGYDPSGTKALSRLRSQWPHSCFAVPPYGQYPPDHPLPSGL